MDKKKYFTLPVLNKYYLNQLDTFFLFETSLITSENYKSYIFINPIKSIECNNFRDIENIFAEIEKLSKQYYLAGFLNYELGYHFQNMVNLNSTEQPLIKFYIFDTAIIFNHYTGKFTCSKKETLNPLLQKNKFNPDSDYKIENIKLDETFEKYKGKIRKIKKYLSEGDTYQVNYTLKKKFNFRGNIIDFYNDLKMRQPVEYSVLVKNNKKYIISLSPELFFKIQDGKIISKPMKGTMARGKNIKEDRYRQYCLKNSKKNQAENIMIVDMVRNDLSKICRSGTVKVPDFFTIEKYKTLFQMTSTVLGKLNKNLSYYDIFKALFPGASITGAPKYRTMEIINELEEENRNVYCGALGIIFPGSTKKSEFNIPIRTIEIINNQGIMGIGSGIVYDSKPDREYNEVLLKKKFFDIKPINFQLIETILWDKKYVFLREHLFRMRSSAKYFDYNFEYNFIKKEMLKLTKYFDKNKKYKVRVLLDKAGKILFHHNLFDIKNIPDKKIIISKKRTNKSNVFLYHKTTNRNLYNTEYKKYSKQGYYEVIFLNNNNEITEGAISNIIIKKDNLYLTPKISCGILDGIYRKNFIKNNNTQETILYTKDLFTADNIYVCNSVRGLQRVVLSM